MSHNIKDFDHLARSLASIKDEFTKTHVGNSLQEPIPLSMDSIPVDHLDHLHKFATSNILYHTHHTETISGIECTVYDGDTDRYWLASIQHKESNAPFSPTWIISAYVLARLCLHLGYKEIVDIGSGDGRIAFCASLLGMRSYSIEITPSLVKLQKSFTGVCDFVPFCSDATSFDYSALGLCRPAFFIGGLAQMGGFELASNVISLVDSIPDTCWVLAGTISPKYAIDPKGDAGWGTFIEQQSLETIYTIDLPTAWTIHVDSTRYVFARSLI